MSRTGPSGQDSALRLGAEVPSPAWQRWPHPWLTEEKADSSAGSLGRTLARSPGVRPRYDSEYFGANVFLTPEEGEKCLGRA